jgi:hypothetical protein
MVTVHPSHKGSTYVRKPKKKKKKKRPVSAKPQEHYDAYYLAPADPNAIRPAFIEEDELNYNAGGKAAAIDYEAASFEQQPEEAAGMEDMEQAPPEEKPKKKRRKKPSSISTLESGFSVMKKEKKDVELLDYDKMAEADQQHMVYYGTANIQGEEMDPNALLEPLDQDLETEDTPGVSMLSYKKVKMHQYKMHPRDR